MLNAGIVGVAIGLILLYLVLSHITAGLNEAAEAVLKRRADYLEAGILDLLEPEVTAALKAHPLFGGLSPDGGRPKVLADTGTHSSDTTKRKPSYVPATVFSKALLSVVTDGQATLHVAIPAPPPQGDTDLTIRFPFARGLGFPPTPFKVRIDDEVFDITKVTASVDVPDEDPPKDPPDSYPAEIWTAGRAQDGTQGAPHAAGAQVARVRPPAWNQNGVAADLRSTINGIPVEGLRNSLLALLDSSDASITSFRAGVEEWFNAKMDRVSGWYKRRTMPLLFAWGLLLAVVLNADTVLVARMLWSDTTLRANVTAEAQAIVSAGGICVPPVAGGVTSTATSTTQDPFQCADNEIKKLQDLKIPLGWSPVRLHAGVLTPWRWNSLKWKHQDDPRVPHGLSDWLLKVAGLLLTALAVLFGAPFWFDLLNKVINFRSAGPPKPSAATPPTT